MSTKETQQQCDFSATLQVVYYNAVSSTPLLLLFIYYNDEYNTLISSPHIHNTTFHINFLLSCMLAFCMNISSNLCTIVTDPTTTSVTGQAKNVFTMLYGALFMSSKFHTPVFTAGMLLGIVGSIMYFYNDEISKDNVNLATQLNSYNNNSYTPKHRNHDTSNQTSLDIEQAQPFNNAIKFT